MASSPPLAVLTGCPSKSEGDTGPSVKDPISQQGGDPTSGRVQHWPNISLHRVCPKGAPGEGRAGIGPWVPQCGWWALGAGMGGSLDQHLEPGATPACTPAPLVQHHRQGQVPEPELLGLCSRLQNPGPTAHPSCLSTGHVSTMLPGLHGQASSVPFRALPAPKGTAPLPDQPGSWERVLGGGSQPGTQAPSRPCPRPGS